MSRKYLFADESGNFDFRDHTKFKNGPSRFLAVGTAMIQSEDDMLCVQKALADLRHTLGWNGIRNDGEFHATTDAQVVRTAVLDVLKDQPLSIDVTILEKSKAQPHLYETDARFYKYAWFYHLRYLAPKYFQPGDEWLIVAASVGTNKKRRAFQDAVDDVVAQCLDYRVKRQIAFWTAGSDPCLQAADYGLWSVMRDVDFGDPRARQALGPRIRHVYELFGSGRVHYYGPNAKKK